MMLLASGFTDSLVDGISAVLLHLLNATAVTFVELFIMFGPLLLAALCSHVVSRRVEYRTIQLAGQNGYIYVLGFLGTPVHELGHALMCVLFRHRIEEIRLFKPDKETGTLGFVRHSYNQRSLYQQVGNFFIALGPIVLGGIVLFSAAWLLLGSGLLYADVDSTAAVTTIADIPAAIRDWFGQIFINLGRFFSNLDYSDYKTWIFLYLVLAIGSHVNLSPSDLVSARTGFTILCVVLFVANVFLLLFLDVPLQAFHMAGRCFGLLSSIILVCTGIMVPIWLMLELVGKLVSGR